MKININNKISLSFQTIGQAIDDYLKNTKGNTKYIGKQEYLIFDVKDNFYKMNITTNKNSTSIVIDIYDVEAKEISTKDLKFPKLPKIKKGVKNDKN